MEWKLRSRLAAREGIGEPLLIPSAPKEQPVITDINQVSSAQIMQRLAQLDSALMLPGESGAVTLEAEAVGKTDEDVPPPGGERPC